MLLKFKFILPSAMLFILAGCNNNADVQNNADETTAATPIPALNYNILNVYPHDTASFTQGLVVYKGRLYESTGGRPGVNNYKSWVSAVDVITGKQQKKVALDTAYFGEGITILNDKIYQLTWENKKGFVYDVASLKKLQEFPLKTEGWGITNDGKALIVSDGSSNLYFLNAETFATEKVISVTNNGEFINNLNELEYINGAVYANKWQSGDIYKIDPANGKVLAKANFDNLLNEYAKEYLGDEKYTNGEGVLNGIAYDSANGKIFITGKLWPKLFEIKFN
jgi:glutaminyl-peptide cyclotransferase